MAWWEAERFAGVLRRFVPQPALRPLICLALGIFTASSVSAPGQSGGGAQSAGSPTRPAPAPRFVVVLDAAHGGDDNGGRLGPASGAGVAEKAVTLALSVRLRSLLTARGFTVVTTREGNANVAADARAQIANRATAGVGAACLSLHASQSGSGVHLFVSSLAPTAPERFLPWKTAQSAFVSQSLKLAGTVNSAVERTNVAGGGISTGADSSSGASGAIPATLGRAVLPGVDSMTCPAVAVEMAPIRATDRGADAGTVTEVSDPQYQTQLVEALAAALLAWQAELETEPSKPGSASGAAPGPISGGPRP